MAGLCEHTQRIGSTPRFYHLFVSGIRSRRRQIRWRHSSRIRVCLNEVTAKSTCTIWYGKQRISHIVSKLDTLGNSVDVGENGDVGTNLEADCQRGMRQHPHVKKANSNA